MSAYSGVLNKVQTIFIYQVTMLLSVQQPHVTTHTYVTVIVTQPYTRMPLWFYLNLFLIFATGRDQS